MFYEVTKDVMKTTTTGLEPASIIANGSICTKYCCELEVCECDNAEYTAIDDDLRTLFN